MKKSLLLSLLAVSSLLANAQLYYKDIIVVKAANQRHAINKLNKVKSIRFISSDGENKPIEGFSSEQQFSRDFSEVTTRTNTTLTGPTLSISVYNTKSQLVKTLDTADGSNTTVEYTYDNNDRISTITSITTSAGDFRIKETHQWKYNAQGKPVSVIKIKNDRDTSLFEIVLDEKGNPAEEKGRFKGKALPTVYYYYDDDNNLTDIVRYNNIAKRLLPDYVFEYDEKNRLGSMMVVPEEGSDYQKWYYSYDEDGLKILDACYSKTKVLIGKVEYEYSYY
jgi:YD repeat-containing protein